MSCRWGAGASSSGPRPSCGSCTCRRCAHAGGSGYTPSAALGTRSSSAADCHSKGTAYGPFSGLQHESLWTPLCRRGGVHGGVARPRQSLSLPEAIVKHCGSCVALSSWMTRCGSAPKTEAPQMLRFLTDRPRRRRLGSLEQLLLRRGWPSSALRKVGRRSLLALSLPLHTSPAARKASASSHAL